IGPRDKKWSPLGNANAIRTPGSPRRLRGILAVMRSVAGLAVSTGVAALCHCSLIANVDGLVDGNAPAITPDGGADSIAVLRCSGPTVEATAFGGNHAGTKSDPWPAQAIAEAANSLATGGTVHVAAGAWLLGSSDAVVTASGVCLVGDGQSTNVYAT